MIGIVGLKSVTWALLAALGVLGALLALLVWAWLTGRLTLDLGWGRSTHTLGPLDVLVDAPRDMVYQVAAAPYLGQMPRDMRGALEVLERGSDLVVAAHHTRVWWFSSTTLESVRFEEPERISFRLLRGVAPSVVEEFAFEQTDRGTVFTYRGQLAMDFWMIGRIAGRRLVAPIWTRVVRGHMEQVKAAAERRSDGRRSA